MVPIKFQDNWPFVSEKEAKNRFSRWRPSWISHRNNFSYFFIYKSTKCFLPSFISIGLTFQDKKQKKKKDFQDGGRLGLRIGTILAIFDIEVAPMLATKF